MKNLLIISGHTDLSTSVANKQILETLETKFPEAEIVKLDSLYPDYKINTEVEQARLLKADIILLQFPLFWWSAPSILHRWMEETFLHGFSHGSTGDKLKGKLLLLSITAGGPTELYSETGAMGHGIEHYTDFLLTACHFTGMKYAGCVFTGGVNYANRTTPELIEEQKAAAIVHATKVANEISKL